NSSRRTTRSPRRVTSFTSAPATSSGGIASPAGEAVPRFPPIVPRLRICGPPTVRDASASAGSRSDSGGCIASVYVSPEPSQILPFSRDQPRSSATSFRFSSAVGRPRSKFRSTITSVPPWIGTAPGRSAFICSASPSVRGLSTSTATSVLGCRERIERRMADLARRLAVARGDEPADVVARDGRDPDAYASGRGSDGVHWRLDASAEILLDVYFMASSCVPASSFESPRRSLTVGDLEGLLRRRRVIGLAEMMNFPGVVAGDEGELAKLTLATHVDGHAPGVRGRDLQAYAAAGIRSDHEASTVEEGRERLRAGMWLLIREASAARNLAALLPLVQEYGPHRIAFCTDDREPEHIADDGHINAMVRDAVALGVPPEDALVLATLNPATWHGLSHLGAVAPGYQADLLVLPDLDRFLPDVVLKAGAPVGDIAEAPVPDWARNTVRVSH